jgi:hypothetical protein
MPEQVFLNCLPEDIPLAKGIDERLKQAGISFYAAPASLSPAIQKEMVEKIQSIGAAHGCMVCILSQKAISNSLFISNIQLMCETARSGRVLVKYQVEELASDQSIRLFGSQAYQVKNTGHPAEDISGIIKRVNQIIHPPARNIFQLLTGIISRRALIGLVSAFAVLGVIASVFFNYSQKAPPAPVLPAPTPVIIYPPFSGQSQNAGLTVDARFVPSYKPVTDPVIEAPFFFKPGTILEQDDFKDPAFNNSFDGRKWNLNHFMLDDIASMAVTQTNGVLQIAVAPAGIQPVSLTLESKYLFNPDQVTYLGYRFRLNDYQGKLQNNTVFTGNFYYGDIGFNGQSQRLEDEQKTALGSRWHTVEMLSEKDKHFVDVFLDGKQIKTLTFDDVQLVQWTQCVFTLNAANTTDWARIQIDEVVFGADAPLPEALQPENAPYRFTPDTIDVHEDFKTQSIHPFVIQDAGFITQANGVLTFNFPSGKDDERIRIEFPGKPINEDNYYATRFRFTSPDNNAWADWASFYIGLVNKNFQDPQGFNLFIGTLRREYNFQGMYGLNGIVNAFAYNQGVQPGIWHTLEMVIRPPADSSQQYTLYYWVDGYLLGKGNLQDPAPFLDKNVPLVASIQIDSGAYRQNVFSGEINDLVIGTLASDKIQE